MELRPIRIGDDYGFPMTNEMVAFMDAHMARQKKITTKQVPIEVRREYMQEEVGRKPLYLATRLHIAELWLEMRK